MIDLTNPDEVRREAERRQRLRAEGARTFDAPLGVPLPEVDEDALEKIVEHEGDKLMAALGFEIVRFSHPGRTKQTPGIPDRRYYRRRRVVVSDDRERVDEQDARALWWEAKSSTGEQRPDQKLFQELVEACGETYLVGTYQVLLDWLARERIAVVINGVVEPVTE